MDIETILARKGSEVRTIRGEQTVGDALRSLRKLRISALVVSTDGRAIEGIVSDRGIMNILVDQGVRVLERPLREMMTHEVVTCSPSDPVTAIMAVMTERRIRHIPVVDGAGMLCGIVSIGDLVKHRLDEIQLEADAMREYITGSR
ncbi:CBS domain-containing protein [Geminicoccaceae bacterium 1502E]|nr:CBS domain-containing protein [Geminicoccaceae bacterium 1502E]